MIFVKTLLYLPLLCVIYSMNTTNYNIRIIQSSIVGFLPQLKLHHTIGITKKDEKGILLIDFTPTNQGSLRTLTKLLFAYNVPAEIRIRRIDNLTVYDNDDDIVSVWDNMNKVTTHQSVAISENAFNLINDKELKLMITKFRNWKESMNLYTNNCQHYSNFVLSMV